MMRRVLFVVVLTIVMVACGPSRHAIPVEMRYPSKSGVELAGKVVSVVYLCTGELGVDEFNEGMAEAFAKALENDYGTGEGSVGLYSVDGSRSAYTEKDSLFNLLMNTGADLVFLFDAPTISKASSSASRTLTVSLYCFDGMDTSEKVRVFSGSTVLSGTGTEPMESMAAETGKRVAEPFFSQWKNEQYSIAYYDGAKWYEALVRADQYDWKGAMDIWFDLLDSNDVMKRSCAEYNIAVACYMMGDLDLAEQWLDRSDTENRMPTLSDALRKRIEARKH